MVFGLAVISPGPDFVMVVKNSMIHSRRSGIFTSLGFGVAILIHVTYTVLGLAAVIAQSIMLFNIIKLAGAAYLIFIGIKAILSRGAAQNLADTENGSAQKSTLGDFASFCSGFFTNALNPKATLFFLAIFSQIIRPDTPFAWYVVYGLTCSVMVSGWFSLVSIVLTHKSVRGTFLRATKWIDRGCGLLMIGLGVKVAISQK